METRGKTPSYIKKAVNAYYNRNKENDEFMTTKREMNNKSYNKLKIENPELYKQRREQYNLARKQKRDALKQQPEEDKHEQIE